MTSANHSKPPLTSGYALTPEQLAWHRHMLNGYRQDAEQAMPRALSGDPDPIFIGRVLELLRTYVEVPTVGEVAQPTDRPLLDLAHVVAGRVVRLGYWQQMSYLWPKLCRLAEFTHDADLYIDFTKYLAIVQGRQGDGQDGFARYQQLISHPYFQQATPDLQADILSHFATLLLWAGQRQRAATLLQRCLALTTAYDRAIEIPPADTTYDRRINMGAAPLWETRAYALNQQGVLHMFCGEFSLAHQCFIEMRAIFLQQQEENDLLCVYHQARGRLLLYEGNYTQACTLLTAGYTIRQARQDREGVAVNAIYLAAAQIGLQQLERAEALLADALPLCQELDNYHDLALCHLYLGLLAYHRAQHDQACVHWQAMATIAARIAIHFVEVRTLINIIPQLIWRGSLMQAEQLTKILWKSIQTDQLGLHDFYCFLRR